MDKSTYLHNFFYGTVKTVLRLYLLDGGSLPGAGHLVQILRNLLEEAFSDVVKEVANAQMTGDTPQQTPPEKPDFPPGFSPN